MSKLFTNDDRAALIKQLLAVGNIDSKATVNAALTAAEQLHEAWNDIQNANNLLRLWEGKYHDLHYAHEELKKRYEETENELDGLYYTLGYNDGGPL